MKNLAFFWLGNLQDFGTIWGPKIGQKVLKIIYLYGPGGKKNLAFFLLGNLQDFGTIWGSKIGQKVVQSRRGTDFYLPEVLRIVCGLRFAVFSYRNWNLP